MFARRLILLVIFVFVMFRFVEAVTPAASPTATPGLSGCAALFTEELPSCIGDVLQVPGVLLSDLINAARYCASTVVSLIVCAAENIDSLDSSCAPELSIIRACVQASVSNSSLTR